MELQSVFFRLQKNSFEYRDFSMKWVPYSLPSWPLPSQKKPPRSSTRGRPPLGPRGTMGFLPFGLKLEGGCTTPTQFNGDTRIPQYSSIFLKGDASSKKHHFLIFLLKFQGCNSSYSTMILWNMANIYIYMCVMHGAFGGWPGLYPTHASPMVRLNCTWQFILTWHWDGDVDMTRQLKGWNPRNLDVSSVWGVILATTVLHHHFYSPS